MELYVIDVSNVHGTFVERVWQNKIFWGPLHPEDEGTTILRNVGNYLPADLNIQKYRCGKLNHVIMHIVMCVCVYIYIYLCVWWLV